MLFEERCLNNMLQQRRIRLHGTQEEELAAISDRLVEFQLFDEFYERKFSMNLKRVQSEQ